MVKYYTFRRAGLGCAFALFSLLATTETTAVAAGAAPSVVSGNVTRLSGTFMTKSEPTEVALPRGGTIRFFADTVASLLTDPQSLMLLPGKTTPTYSIILRRGHVEVELPAKTGSAVAVSTPSDTRIVTLSGHMALNAKGRDVTVASYDGLTTVTQGTKLQRHPNGEKRIYRGKSGYERLELLPATSWAAGRRTWLTTSATASVTGYGWRPVAGAAGYTVALESVDSRRILARTETHAPLFETDGIELGPGRYELKVAAIDSDGFTSPSTYTLPIRVVGVVLPPGAEVRRDASIVLGPDQTVSLTDAEGLTLTTADHRGNVPATAPFGLAGQERASVLVHAPGDGDPSPLTLIRREPSVVAWVGPKSATWPTEAVHLRVSLVSDQGIPLDPHVVPAPKVLVGTELVDVDWRKEGQQWSASLPPRSGKGPWVVRLEVLDQYGVPIGRDFVEVAPASPRHKGARTPLPRAGHAGTI